MIKKMNINVFDHVINWPVYRKNIFLKKIWQHYDLKYQDNAIFNYSYNFNKTINDDFILLTSNGILTHFDNIINHKNNIKKIYNLIKPYNIFTNIAYEQILNHDDSKLTNFLEILGYTDKYVNNKHSDLWIDAYKHHYEYNKHHPNKNNMELCFLEESIINKMAHYLENINDNINIKKLVNGINNTDYLSDYTYNDSLIVEKYINNLLKITN